MFGAYGAVSESLCLGPLINQPQKLTFSSPVGAKVVKHYCFITSVLIFLAPVSLLYVYLNYDNKYSKVKVFKVA